MRPGKPEILAQIKGLREVRPAHFWAGMSVAAVSFGAMVAAFAVAPHAAVLPVDQTTVIEQISLPSTNVVTAEAAFVSQTRIQGGDTVARLLNRLGVDESLIISELSRNPDARQMFRQMRPGKTITAQTDATGRLLSLFFPLNGGQNVLQVVRHGDDIKVETLPLALETEVIAKSGEIRSSLFAATDVANIPDSIAIELAEIFASEIDFHRDLRRGDRFSVVYELLHAEGQVERAGKILAAEFTNQGKSYSAFLFSAAGGKASYYDAKGTSLKKAFLRSPLEFSRISSGFSMRVHPILGTMRAHKGVDYAAPIGTRVRAAGDGVVEAIGAQRGYGNTVVLRHRGQVSTYYAHLRGFVEGLRKGARVSQGDVIGYVGQTGLATGPHLHYEFRLDGVHKDPLTVAMPEAPPLDARLKQVFLNRVKPLEMQLSVVGTGELALVE